MKKQELINDWLKRARSNLERARIGRISDSILYEDLCFDCQQAVEKALKALLVSLEVVFPRTHSIARLMELVEGKELIIPDRVKKAVALTDYAVMARYPGAYQPIKEEEYKQALHLTETAYKWIIGNIKQE